MFLKNCSALAPQSVLYQVSSVCTKVAQAVDFVHRKCGEIRTANMFYNQGFTAGYREGFADGIKARIFVLTPLTFYAGWKLGTCFPVTVVK